MGVADALASFGFGEAPLNDLPFAVGHFVPGRCLFLQGFDVTDAAVSQALPRVHANGDLGLVEPAGMLGRVVNLESIREFPGQLLAHMLLEDFTAVGRQVVHHQHDLFGRRIACGQLRQKDRKLQPITTSRYLVDIDTGLRLYRTENVGTAGTLILVILQQHRKR